MVSPPESSTRDEDAYARAVAAQVRQFPNAEGMHALPAMFWYWVEKHLCAKAEGVIPSVYPDKFFAANIVDAVERTGIPRVLSIGAGDGTQEILIARELGRIGREDVEIISADLSHILVQQAAENIAVAGLADRIRAVQCDLNKGFPPEQVGAVFAIDSLHHMLDLEGLFQAVDEAIGPKGSFIFRDVIGRNGHMRWPEVSEPLRKIWPHLPPRLRFHNLNRLPDPWFENFDCSVEGFEGIRSQDIMKILEERFDFSQIMTYGGLVEVFIDRVYGPNLTAERHDDQTFIDNLQEVEDELLAAGTMYPTQIYAVARRRGTVDAPALRELARRAVRDPAKARPVPLNEAGLKIPYPDAWDVPPLVWGPGDRLHFAAGASGIPALRWGWLTPEATHVWSYREDSAVMLPKEGLAPGVSVVIETSGYVIDHLGPQEVIVTANGHPLGRISHMVSGQHCRSEFLLGPEHFGQEGEVEMRFACNYSRRPDRDGGADGRAIGFVLLAIERAKAAPEIVPPAPDIVAGEAEPMGWAGRFWRKLRG